MMMQPLERIGYLENSMLDDIFDWSEEPKEPKEPTPKILKERPASDRTHFADLIDTDYRMYSMYTIENRAIPSCIDGMKPVQRKLFYAMLQNKGRKIKAAEIGGSLSSYGYAHAEGSAQDAVVKMAQAWATHIPFFKSYGNFGTRMIKEAASPRYIYVSEEDRIKNIFIDNEVLQARIDDHPEPQTYLPVLPWLLACGSQGVAVGFAVRVLPRHPKTLQEACIRILDGTVDAKPLLPSFPGFKGSIEPCGENGWKISGVVEEAKGINNFTVTEVPFSYDREKYYEQLVELEESGKIVSFADHCDSGGFKFQVKLNREQREKFDLDRLKYLGLVETTKENFTTLDETGKLRIFESPTQLIQHFLKYRIQKKAEQIAFDIKKVQEQKEFLEAKLSFIEGVQQVGLTKVATWKVSELKEFASQWAERPADAERLVQIPFYSMTEEEIAKLKEKISKEKSTLRALLELDPKQELKRCIQSLKL